MNNRPTLVLIVLFFGGLIGLWLADRARVPTQAERRRQAGRVLPELIDLPPADVRRVEVSGDGSKGLAFERRDGGWQMIAPLDALADPSMVEALVRQLKDLRPVTGADTIHDSPDRFGLRPPARIVRLFGTDAKTPLAALEVGKSVNNQRYVRQAGHDGIEVVDARLFAGLEKPAIEWREKVVLPLPSFDVERLTVTGPGRDLAARRTAGQWHLLRPIRTLADNGKLEGVVAGLTSLRVADGAQGFVADDVRDWAAYGLDQPRITIELDPARDRGKPLILQVGKPVPGQSERAYARRADQDDVVVVDTSTLQDLGTQVTPLRSQRVVDLDLSRADFLEVRGEGQDQALARFRDGWAIVRPNPAQADNQTVQTLLSRLNEVQTSEFLDPKKVSDPSLDPPKMVIKVWQDSQATSRGSDATPEPKGEPVLVLRLGRADAILKSVFAQTEGDPTVLALPSNLLEVLPSGPLSFHDKTLLTLSPEDIASLTVYREGTTTTVNAGSTKGDFTQWQMVRPVPAPADPDSVARLAVMVARVRAETLVTDKPEDLARYGLDAPALTVSWRTRPPGSGSALGKSAQEWRLRVGKEVIRGKGSRYALLSSSPLVFTITPMAYQYLTAELHNRRVLSFAAEQATRLTVRWPGVSASFRRKARGPGEPPEWVPEPGSEAAGNEAQRLAPVVSALSNLLCVRFVQYEGTLPPEAGLTPPSATFEVQLAGDAGTRRLHLGNPGPEGLRFATTVDGSEGPVILLPDSGWGSWASPPPSLSALPDDVFAAETAAGGR